MAIYYTTTPKSFDELADSCRGQLERMREVAITGEELPENEKVIITTEAFLDTLEQIQQVNAALHLQAEINHSIQQVFLYVFSQLGIEIDEYIRQMLAEEQEDEEEL